MISIHKLSSCTLSTVTLLFIRSSLSLFGYTVFKVHSSATLRGSGGDKEIRTPDPLLARQVLSQLSYTPNSSLQTQ